MVAQDRVIITQFVQRRSDRLGDHEVHLLGT
jgi:hypothetical protein